MHVLGLFQCGHDRNGRQRIDIVGPAHAAQRADVGLSTDEVAQAQGGQAPGLREGAGHEDVGQSAHFVLQCCPWGHELVVALVHEQSAVGCLLCYPKNGFARDCSAGRVVGVAEHDKRRAGTNQRKDLVHWKALVHTEKRTLDHKALRQRCLLEHRKRGRRNDGLRACGTATADNQVNRLVRAVREHALLGLDLCIGCDCFLEVGVGGVALQALGIDVRLDGISDMRRNRHRTLVEVQQQVLGYITAFQRRLVGLELPQVRLEHRRACLRARKELQCGLVEFQVGGGNHAAARLALQYKLFTVPVGHSAARAHDDWHQRCVVVNPQVCFDDEVRTESRGHERIGVAIATVEWPLHSIAHNGEALSLEASSEHERRCCIEHCVAELCHSSGTHRLSVQQCALAEHANPALLQDALVDQADDRPAVVAKANERAEEWLACDKRFGAVNGV
mmetsp:Transcript_53599/g.124725  ORF Transcript_53599/g.124725 Transcript_53599/m.124725 type:complete len:448 (+) Transcript_53599:442-1785(+)